MDAAPREKIDIFRGAGAGKLFGYDGTFRLVELSAGSIPTDGVEHPPSV